MTQTLKLLPVSNHDLHTAFRFVFHPNVLDLEKNGGRQDHLDLVGIAIRSMGIFENLARQSPIRSVSMSESVVWGLYDLMAPLSPQLSKTQTRGRVLPPAITFNGYSVDVIKTDKPILEVRVIQEVVPNALKYAAEIFRRIGITKDSVECLEVIVVSKTRFDLPNTWN